MNKNAGKFFIFAKNAISKMQRKNNGFSQFFMQKNPGLGLQMLKSNAVYFIIIKCARVRK